MSKFLMLKSLRRRPSEVKWWTKCPQLFLSFLVPGLIILLGGWVTGIDYSPLLHWPLHWPLPSPRFPLTLGLDDTRSIPPAVPGDKQPACKTKKAKVLTGNLLALSCGKTYIVVSLVPVAIPGSSSGSGSSYESTAKRILEDLTVHKQLDCGPDKETSGYTCHAGGIDLRKALIQGGVASVTGAPEGSLLYQAQEQARLARVGMWWDWSKQQEDSKDHKKDPIDPILWRMGRDSMLPNADGARVQRLYIFSWFALGSGAAFSFLFSNFLSERHKWAEQHHESRLKNLAAEMVREIKVLYKDLGMSGDHNWEEYDRQMKEIEEAQDKFKQFVIKHSETLDFGDLSTQQKHFERASGMFRADLNTYKDSGPQELHNIILGTLEDLGLKGGSLAKSR